MQRLKRKHAKLFWALFWVFWGLEGAAWALRLAGEEHPWLLAAASWITILAFLHLLGAGVIWRRRLQCPGVWGRPGVWLRRRLVVLGGKFLDFFGRLKNVSPPRVERVRGALNRRGAALNGGDPASSLWRGLW